MKFRVGACALLVCLAGCSAEGTDTKFGDLMGSASPKAPGTEQVPHVQAGRNPADSIANAPDRGALVSYKNKGVASKQEGAYTWYPIAISEEHALRAVATGQMTIPSPDGSQVKLRYERHVEHADGNWTWIGRVEGGDQKQEAILTFGENAVYGSIPQMAGAPALSLQTRAGELWAIVTDPSKVVSPNKGKNDLMVPPALALRASLAPAVSRAQEMQAAAIAAGAPASAANTIDLAIGFTQGFATAQGGSSAAVTRLNFLVEVGNQAFVNSAVDGYLRIVSAIQVNFADNTDNETALTQLTGHNGSSAIAVPAALAPIRTARDQYGADLAVLVRKFQTPENNGCGIAWLNGADQTAISATSDDDFGFAVVSDGNDTGTDGLSYFCSSETLVHELAHLMGSAHDRDNSTNSQGGLQYGRYQYSFGMKTNSAGGNFYTIMAYGDDNQNFYRTFSNPAVAKCGPSGNLSCGVANQTDNARSLNQTIPVVAQFRARVVPDPQNDAVKHDFNGDRRSDILLQGVAVGRYSIWTMNGAARLGSFNGDTTVGYSVAASGDIDGDGTVESLWVNGGNQIWVLRLVAGSTTQREFVELSYRAASGYTLVGAGDLDGNGKADLVFHSAAVNRFSVWFMDGMLRTGSGSGGMYAGYTLRAIGNFSGAVRSEMVWSGTNGKMSMLAYPSRSFTLKALFNDATAGFTLKGAGDTDLDGKDDLVFQSSSHYEVWSMSDRTRLSLVNTALPAGYSINTIGDYDGDGRASILMGNAARQLQYATRSGTGFVNTPVALTYSGTFTVVDTR